jgi:hypothetical protein
LSSNPNCTGAGGITISVGIDNGDGGGTPDDAILQTGEIDQTSSLCNALVGKRVFLTSGTYTGALGGLSGADASCQSAAVAAGVQGTYKAWLGTAGATPLTTFTHSSDPYYLLDGSKIANNWAGVISGNLLHPIDVTELLQPGSSQLVWTGLREDGTWGGAGNGDCNGWTSAAASGLLGVSDYSNDAWTYAGVLPCNATVRLYCFEQ